MKKLHLTFLIIFLFSCGGTDSATIDYIDFKNISTKIDINKFNRKIFKVDTVFNGKLIEAFLISSENAVVKIDTISIKSKMHLMVNRRKRTISYVTIDNNHSFINNLINNRIGYNICFPVDTVGYLYLNDIRGVRLLYFNIWKEELRIIPYLEK